MKVCVTERHIRNGACVVPKRCPVELAIEELGYEVEVGNCGVYLKKEDQKSSYLLPYEVQTKIQLFDIGYPILPFSFTLE